MIKKIFSSVCLIGLTAALYAELHKNTCEEIQKKEIRYATESFKTYFPKTASDKEKLTDINTFLTFLESSFSDILPDSSISENQGTKVFLENIKKTDDLLKIRIQMESSLSQSDKDRLIQELIINNEQKPDFVKLNLCLNFIDQYLFASVQEDIYIEDYSSYNEYIVVLGGAIGGTSMVIFEAVNYLLKADETKNDQKVYNSYEVLIYEILTRKVSDVFPYVIKNTSLKNMPTAEALLKLQIDKLPDFQPQQFEDMKFALMEISKILDECIKHRNEDGSFEEYKSCKAKINQMRKTLSMQRCDYISNVVLIPRFFCSLYYASLYNDVTWVKRKWGTKAAESAIKNAFEIIGNHGKDILSANERCRKIFYDDVMPTLKKKLSEQRYNDLISRTGYTGDGKYTGAKAWLDWEDR